MDFVEQVGFGPECSEAGLRAEIEPPAAVLRSGEVGGVGLAEDASAQGDEWVGFPFGRNLGHMILTDLRRFNAFNSMLLTQPSQGFQADYPLHSISGVLRDQSALLFLDFGNEDFEGADGQPTRRFGGL